MAAVQLSTSRALVLYRAPHEGEARMRDALMARSFRAQFADVHFLPWTKGDVIVIAGTSTAGKSSIVGTLLQYEPDRQEEDLDLRGDPREMPGPLAQVEMIDDAIVLALQGVRVVIHVDQGHKFLGRLFERNVWVPTRVVLAYCPFGELARRLIGRNVAALGPSGDDKNARDPLMPIANFAELYTRIEEPGTGLEVITRARATAVFRAHFDGMIRFAQMRGHDLPPPEQIALDKENAQKEFLAKLGFEEGMDRVEVGPRRRADYTHIFNTYVLRDAVGIDRIARALHF